MPDYNENEKKLPWPEESDPSKLGDRFEHGADAEQREAGESFAASNEASERVLGREFADPNIADSRKVGEAFADPNSKDDRSIGKNFEEANFSGKKKKPPLAERIHKPANRRPLYIGLVVFAALFILVLLIGGLPKLFRNREIDKKADKEKNAKPVVQVVKIGRAKERAGLALPGTTIPLTEAFVYARANGYLKTLKVDIGDHVKKGQLLAIVDAPDLDAQVDQAREQVRQAEQQLEQQKSQLALATVTVQRYRVLVTKGVFSRQQGDQEEATYSSSVANVAAAQRNVQAYKANLDRQISLQSYEQVRAPFDGVVTQRNVDIGALISTSGAASSAMAGPSPQGQTSTAGGTAQAGQSNNSGSSGSSSTAATSAQSPGQGGPLFAIAQLERLRILVSVPEGYAPLVHIGEHAQLAFQEYESQQFDATITRTSNSVDQNTRTMLTEIQVDNHGGKLLSGMYVVATFPPITGGQAPIVISGDAVVIRHDQPSLALVKDGKIRIVPVTLGRDLGDVIEIVAGVEPGDMVVTDVTDDVVDGAQVESKVTKSQDDKPQKEPPQNTPPGGSTRYSNDAITDKNLQGQQQSQDEKSSGQGKDASSKASKSESKP